MPRGWEWPVLRTRPMRAHAHLVLLLLALAASGCARALSLDRADGAAPAYENSDPLGNDDDQAGDDDDGGGSVDVGILNLDPAPDASDHHYRAPISATFTESAIGTSITVVDESGATVPIELSWNADSTRVWIWPQPRLTPDRGYSVELLLGGQLLAYSFRTSRVGLLDPGTELQGATYALDLRAMRLLSPEGLGSNVQPSAEASPVIHIVDADPYSTQLEFGLGYGDAGNWSQDSCAVSGAVTTDGSILRDAAYVAGDVDILGFPLGGASVQLEQASVAFDIEPDGEGLVALGLSGWLKEASLGALLGSDAACELVASSASDSCAPCPSGSGLCLWVDLDGVRGDRIGLQLDTELLPDGDGCPEGLTAYPGCSLGDRSGGTWIALLLAALGVAFRRRASADQAS